MSTPPPPGETLGQLVKRERLRRGMSQKQLAERVGVAREYISQIESGRSQWPAQYVAALSAALELAPSEMGRAAGRIVSDADFVSIAGKSVGTSSASMTLDEPGHPVYDATDRTLAALWSAMSPDDRQAWLSLGRHLAKQGAGTKRETDRAEDTG